MILLISCFKVLQQSHIKLVTLGTLLLSFSFFRTIFIFDYLICKKTTARIDRGFVSNIVVVITPFPTAKHNNVSVLVTWTVFFLFSNTLCKFGVLFLVIQTNKEINRTFGIVGITNSTTNSARRCTSAF